MILCICAKIYGAKNRSTRRINYISTLFIIWLQAKITIRISFSLLLGDSAFIPSWFQLGAWALVCRNLCQRVGVKGYNGSLYNKGMNYCSRCAVYFHNEGATHCFCCGSKLRYKSRGAKKRKDQGEVMQHELIRGI
jgi:uncharacterized paraquat-inducible protein A